MGDLRKIVKTKKNGFEDTFFVIAVLFTIAIILLIMVKVFGEIKQPLDTALSGAIPNNSGVNMTANLDKVESTGIMFSKLMPLLIIGLIGFVFIGTAIYAKSPFMIFIGIIILAVAFLLGIIYANLYQSIAESDSFADTNAKLSLQGKFMKYLPFVILIMFIAIIAAVLYGRSGGSSQY